MCPSATTSIPKTVTSALANQGMPSMERKAMAQRTTVVKRLRLMFMGSTYKSFIR